MRAIVTPLVDRALNITPPGRNVFVQSMVNKPSGGGDTTVTIVIRDEGPSLTASQIERLFFPFQSVETDIKTGLELARARRIVLARAGTITVEPDNELGSRVTVHLPTPIAASTEAAA